MLGNSISLTARNGGIGTSGDFVEIDSSRSSAGLVDAVGNLGVFMREVAGDLRLGGVASLASDVVLITLAGSILDGTADVDDRHANIQATNVDLVVAGGSIGTAANSVDIYGAGTGQRPALQNASLQLDYAVPGTGRLVANAAAGVYVNEVIAGLNLLRVAASAGDVRITTNDSVTVDDLTRVGDDNITLLLSGTTWDGVAVVGGSAVEASGSATVIAGDNVLVPAGTAIVGGTSVLVGGDPEATDFDVDGTTIDIQGDLRAPSVVIQGGKGLDYLQIDNPAGINAGHATTVRGHDGDDRIFVRAVSAAAGSTLTLEGGAGADRFFLSSNASKALFMNGTSYDEPDDPLAAMKGRMDSLGGVVVDAGTGGNGGTVDAIYVTSEAATSAVTGSVSGGIVNGATAGSISGFGMTGSISYTAATGMYVGVQLTKFDDTMAVDAVASTVVLAIDGSDGNDTLNVGQATGSLAGIAGIVSFAGGAGTDTLNVYGDASAVAGQLTAIGLTGMGMGSNQFVAVHNTNFGAGYSTTQSDWPAAIYYGRRTVVTDAGVSTDVLSSTVEAVNVQLGGGNDSLLRRQHPGRRHDDDPRRRRRRHHRARHHRHRAVRAGPSAAPARLHRRSDPCRRPGRQQHHRPRRQRRQHAQHRGVGCAAASRAWA